MLARSSRDGKRVSRACASERSAFSLSLLAWHTVSSLAVLPTSARLTRQTIQVPVGSAASFLPTLPSSSMWSSRVWMPRARAKSSKLSIASPVNVWAEYRSITTTRTCIHIPITETLSQGQNTLNPCLTQTPDLPSSLHDRGMHLTRADASDLGWPSSVVSSTPIC